MKFPTPTVAALNTAFRSEAHIAAILARLDDPTWPSDAERQQAEAELAPWSPQMELSL